MAHSPPPSTAHPPLEHFAKIAPIILDPKTDPRVIAILGAAYLEHYLTEVIARLLPGLNSKLRDRLFRPPGPLSELGAKIDMTRALGAFTNEYRRQCIIVARIRNRFAHQLDIEDFDHPEIAKLCKKLPKATITGFEGASISKKITGTPQAEFIGNVLELCGVLSNALNPGSGDGPSPSQSK